MNKLESLPTITSLDLSLKCHISSAQLQDNGITFLEDGKIKIQQYNIDNSRNPDIALIDAFMNTPVQINKSESTLHEIILGSDSTIPFGIITMSPEPDQIIKQYVYDPLRNGGQVGLSLPPGWIIQIIVPNGAHIKFCEIWDPIGFSYKVDSDEKSYGEKTLGTLSSERLSKEFQTKRDGLDLFLNTLANLQENRNENEI